MDFSDKNYKNLQKVYCIDVMNRESNRALFQQELWGPQVHNASIQEATEHRNIT